jgi:chemotaxis family two-component system response regulator Rcp1
VITTSKIFRILVVEDNPADVYLLGKALEQAGINCELEVIDGGAEALEFVRNHIHTKKDELDLAILDVNLPTNTGIEVLAEIRQNRALSDMPVVVLTSSAAPHERRQAEQLRVARFITKPPDLANFLKIGDMLKEVLLGGEPRPAIV